jgi:hypothetical protein
MSIPFIKPASPTVANVERLAKGNPREPGNPFSATAAKLFSGDSCCCRYVGSRRSDYNDAKGRNVSGGWGESARTTTIDLTKRSDLALVHRAVVNGWDVPCEIRLQIVDQLGAVLSAAKGNARRVLKLCKLMLALEARNQIADGAPAIEGAWTPAQAVPGSAPAAGALLGVGRGAGMLRTAKVCACAVTVPPARPEVVPR